MLKIEVGRGSDFEPCEVHYMELGNNCFVGFKVNGDYVTVYEHREVLAAELEVLLRQVKRGLSPKRLVKSEARPSPVETVQHFRESPELAAIAPDVERLLGPVDGLDPMIEEARQFFDPADLFDGQGEPVWGARARVAEFIGKPDAGSYRKQITDILAGITPTTTQKPAQNAQKCA